MRGFEDKVALVTGAGSGIGRTTALMFAREGARTVVADVAVEDGEDTRLMIENAGGKAIFLKADVTKPDEVESLVQKAVHTYGRLDCAFNNAGIGGAWAATADYPEWAWDQVISVNLKGVWLCLKYEITQMLRQGHGSIVNTASATGLVGSTAAPAYVASKHGVVGLTKAAALDYAAAGIRINAVCPGAIHTPMIGPFMEAHPEMALEYASMHPVGRIGEANEVAEAVLWLCSDAASFVTGHAMTVDGGFSAG